MWLGYPVNHEAPRGDALLFLHPQADREPSHDQHPHRHEQDGDDDVNPQDRVSCIEVGDGRVTEPCLVTL